MFVGIANSGNALAQNSVFLLTLLAELGEGHLFVVFRLCFELIDQIHLLINFDQKVLHVSVNVEDISCDFGLDVLRSIRISKSILGLVKVLA